MKLYNGIPLPALPEWDKTVYTHGFVQYGGVTGMETYSLIVSTASGVMGDSYTVGEHTYSAWVVAANEQSAANLSGAYPGISTKEWLQFEDGKTVTASTYDNIVWSDFDILKTDGSVYLKATKPFDLDAFKIGLSLGLCGKALPWKAEPVAWLYNGVRLPKLPDTDYQYLSISTKLGIVSKYRYLWAYADPVLATGNNATSTLAIPRPCLRWKLTDDNWVEDALPEDEILTSDSAIIGLWANYNVYYVDDSAAGETLGFEPGSLYLAKSDPVPIYE